MQSINRAPRPIDQDDMLPIIGRLARLLAVREIERQDVERLSGRRVKAYTEAVARLDGAAGAVERVVNAWGPQQILTTVARAIGDVPPHTSSGRKAWFDDRVERLTAELLFIYRDEN
jgi:hypothetical protein